MHDGNVFKSPDDAKKIKDVLESISLETGEMAKVYFDDDSNSIENTLFTKSKHDSGHENEVHDNVKTMHKPVFTNSKYGNHHVKSKRFQTEKGNHTKCKS